MRSKLFAVITALALVFAFSAAGSAQTLTTDLIFLKVGYIPVSLVTYDETWQESVESTGLAVQGEYNLNYDTIWIGFGLEYQRLVSDVKEKGTSYESHVNQFIQPMISIKFAALGGLYVGAGLSGKYLIATEKFENPADGSNLEWEKRIDLWANGILGYYMPIAEAVFLDLEGRFGYNITNGQFDKVKGGSKLDITSTYDVAFYIGIGTRAKASDY